MIAHDRHSRTGQKPKRYAPTRRFGCQREEAFASFFSRLITCYTSQFTKIKKRYGFFGALFIVSRQVSRKSIQITGQSFLVN